MQSLATAGPDRPITDEEREQLGTRRSCRTYPGRPPSGSSWTGPPRTTSTAGVRPGAAACPPFVPDLKECRRCTIGAAYARSRGDYPLSKPALCCFNRECYDGKAEAGADDCLKKIEAHKKGLFRQDRQVAIEFIRQTEPLSVEARTALATALLAATPRLVLQHPFGVYQQDWSYESGAAARIREMLGIENPRIVGGLLDLDAESLDVVAKVGPGGLRELIANLMAYHLRLAGQLEG